MSRRPSTLSSCCLKVPSSISSGRAILFTVLASAELSLRTVLYRLCPEGGGGMVAFRAPKDRVSLGSRLSRVFFFVYLDGLLSHLPRDCSAGESNAKGHSDLVTRMVE